MNFVHRGQVYAQCISLCDLSVDRETTGLLMDVCVGTRIIIGWADDERWPWVSKIVASL